MRGVVIAIALISAVAEAKGTAAGAGPIRTFTDSTGTRKVWLDPTALAEPSRNTLSGEAIRDVDPKAEVLASTPSMRLWRLSISADRALDLLAKRAPAQRFLRVFRDAPSTSGRARVLTGRLVLTLSPEAALHAEDWFSGHGVRLVRPLPAPENTFVVAPSTRPEDAVAKLAADRDVRSAALDWWLESAPR